MRNHLNSRLKARRQEAGFTLIELLIVIVIIAILAAIVVLSVGGIGDKGQLSACKSDASTLRTAEEAYFASQTTGSVYTADQSVLVTKGFLSQPSTLHTVAVTAATATTPASISLTKVGACAGLSYTA